MRKMNSQCLCVLALICAFFAQYAYAKSYQLDDVNDVIIGELDAVVIDDESTLLDLARYYGLGYQDIKLLNPDVDTWLPKKGQIIELPLKFILPAVERKGLVLNIPEMRLYYFPIHEEGKPIEVVTYPLGVGRAGWETPYRKTRIIGKREYPDWTPPESIRKEHEEAGDPLPEIVEAGPDNPLGDYALRLGMPAYLIHGTNKPWGIGMRVSHGCIRLYPEDIAELFYRVEVNTPVNIINMPYKIAEQDGVLYLEVHPPLKMVAKDRYDDEAAVEINTAEVAEEIVEDWDFDDVITMIMSAIKSGGEYEINWGLVMNTVDESKGIPVAVGIHIL